MNNFVLEYEAKKTGYEGVGIFRYQWENVPKPWNPLYNPAHVALVEKKNKELRAYGDTLSDDLSIEEFDRLYNTKSIELDCEYEFYGYKYVDGYPTHNTERGTGNIAKLFGKQV